MSDNLKFWNNFYKNKKKFKHSNFAKFVLKKKVNYDNIIDIGCGNGRDSFFFSKKFKYVIGIDKSNVAIKNNSKKNTYNNLFFKKIDITTKNINLKKKFNNIYARFFLHTLNLREERLFFHNLKKLTNKNSIIFLEFRTDKDKLIKRGKKISKFERITDHYRRFININDLKKRLMRLKFKIIYSKQSNNFSIQKNDRPHLSRLILKKI